MDTEVTPSSEDVPAQIVLIGSSAAGSGSLTRLLERLPSDLPAPVVLIHDDAVHPVTDVAADLAQHAILPLHPVAGEVPLEPGSLYLLPANRPVSFTRETVAIDVNGRQPARRALDQALTNAAETFGEGLFVVLLSDLVDAGAIGSHDVARLGGTIIVQMMAASAYGYAALALSPLTVDLVARVEEIHTLLGELLSGTYASSGPDDNQTLIDLLTQLRDRSGIDFSAYKRPTIIRRLQRRITATGTESLAGYVRHLAANPDEYRRLVSSFLIKVTEFFRDPELFDYLRGDVLPELIQAGREHGNEIRLWSAGCATGEEAYSLAILVCEALGDELDSFKVRIFATDLDNDAIAFARHGVYPASALTNLPPALVDRYFNGSDGQHEIKKSLRALTVFGQHDLGQRAPFPRIDLCLCRNVLIYFTTELQRRALQLFAFSLRDGGRLVLGKSESTSPLGEYFTLDHPRLRIYRRQGDRVLIPPARIRDSAPLTPPRPQFPRQTLGLPDLGRFQREPRRIQTARERAENLLLNLPVGVVVTDRRYDVQLINGSARRLLGIHSAAIGEDFIHQAQAIPPLELRSLIDAALRGQTPSQVFEIDPGGTDGGVRCLDIACYPREADPVDSGIEGVMVLITDVTSAVRQQREAAEQAERHRQDLLRLTSLTERLAETNRQLLAANQELATVNAELRSANEELLVSNEEVQAATEEVETLNEEMQASNEELETLNEELQATVEELNTTNDDLQARSAELQELATSLELQQRESEDERARLAAIVSSIGDAVMVVDQSGEVILNNAAYARLFGDRAPIRALDPQSVRPLPTEQTPQARAARGEGFRMEFSIGSAAGGRRRFEANGAPVQPRGSELGGVVVIRDITDRPIARQRSGSDS